MSNIASAAATGLPALGTPFAFELGQRVNVADSDITGVVIGRTEYLDGMSKFGITFLDEDALERTRWYSARFLVEA